MEIQLQELLERIRSEGVETATQQAEEIIRKAQSEALEIVNRAKKKPRRHKEKLLAVSRRWRGLLAKACCRRRVMP